MEQGGGFLSTKGRGEAAGHSWDLVCLEASRCLELAKRLQTAPERVPWG